MAEENASVTFTAPAKLMSLTGVSVAAADSWMSIQTRLWPRMIAAASLRAAWGPLLRNTFISSVVLSDPIRGSICHRLRYSWATSRAGCKRRSKSAAVGGAEE